MTLPGNQSRPCHWEEWKERLFLERTSDASLGRVCRAGLCFSGCRASLLLQSGAVGAVDPPRPPHVHARGNLSWLLLTDVMLWSAWGGGGGGPQWCPPGLLREQKRASTLVTGVIRNLEGRSFGVLGGPKWDHRDLPGQRTQPNATLRTFWDGPQLLPLIPEPSLWTGRSVILSPPT